MLNDISHSYGPTFRAQHLLNRGSLPIMSLTKANLGNPTQKQSKIRLIHLNDRYCFVIAKENLQMATFMITFKKVTCFA